MPLQRISIAAVCMTVCLVLVLHYRATSQSLASEPPGKPVREKAAVTIPTDVARQKKELRPYMRAKLDHAQNVFEGLVLRDFKKIEENAEALMITSFSAPGVPPGENRDDEVFEHLKLEFLRLSGRLKELAAKKNLEGAAYVTEQLNASCISCHQYLRDDISRIPNAVKPATGLQQRR